MGTGSCPAAPAIGRRGARDQRRLSDPGAVEDGLPDDELLGLVVLDEEVPLSVSVSVLVPEVDGYELLPVPEVIESDFGVWG
mgnify:CR=1 FL=1